MEYVITLVHGTFARQAAWTRTESPLCRRLSALSQSNPIVFRPFVWSGLNSPLGRRRASIALRTHLSAALSDHPTARHYVIGHSHGGNVVTMALADDALRARIAGVVCLSTPFLHARWRPFGLPFTVLSLLGLPALFVFDAAFATLTAAIGVAMILWMWLTNVPARLIQALHTAPLVGLNLLIVRTPADETGAAFAVSHIVAWLSTRAYALIAFVIRRAFVTPSFQSVGALVPILVLLVLSGLVSAAMFAFVDTVSEFLFSKYLDPTPIGPLELLFAFVIGVFIPITVLAAVAAVNALLLTLLSITFGPAAACCALLVEVSAEAAPPGRWMLCQIGYPDGHSSSLTALQHSQTYADPRAIEAVADWIARLESPTPASV